MKRLVQFAFVSRLLVICFQVILNLCIPDHDANVFHTPVTENSTMGDHVISLSLDGFRRWDAQYFLHIAQFGYTYENTLAFFPLFPLLLSIIFYILSPVLVYTVNVYNCLLLIGVAVNVLLFIFSAVFLHSLTMLIFKNKSIARVSALLFCLNPASVFFSSLYSESLFSFLTFAGLFYVEKQNCALALIFLSFSASTRSNGILSVGFIIHSELKRFLNKYLSIKTCDVSSSVFFFVASAIKLLFKVVVFFIPFLTYQTYSYFLFCKSHTLSGNLPTAVIDHAQKQGYKLYGGTPSEWCYWKIPMSYSYVQSHYWNVGFLRYYEAKQIPNFLLALPLLIIIVHAVVNYCRKNSKLISNLGLIKSTKQRFPTMYENEKCFVYFAHAAVLAVICIFFIHIQVSTRLFASSSPVLYWIAATLITSGNVHHGDYVKDMKKLDNTVLQDCYHLYKSVARSNIPAKLVFSYFSLYFILGILLHVNYLPWT